MLYQLLFRVLNRARATRMTKKPYTGCWIRAGKFLKSWAFGLEMVHKLFVVVNLSLSSIIFTLARILALMLKLNLLQGHFHQVSVDRIKFVKPTFFAFSWLAWLAEILRLFADFYAVLALHWLDRDIMTSMASSHFLNEFMAWKDFRGIQLYLDFRKRQKLYRLGDLFLASFIHFKRL